MMHMWMWFGYDLGEFMFPGLDVDAKWSFALTCIVLFVVSVLFEGSKLYLARLQKEAKRKLFPYRTDERRNLLCQYDRERAGVVEPSTSRNVNVEVTRWTSLRTRILVNSQQSSLFVVHNTVGYLLMLAVMVYNVYLLIAVILGTMLGHFLFGTQLIRLQMQCASTKRVVICTPECDDAADSITPPLLDSSMDSESEMLTCQTKSCSSQHYPSTSQAEGSSACHFGAKNCPSKVARVKKTKQSPQGCCKQSSDAKCCKTQVTVHSDVTKADESSSVSREESPAVSCCHQKKSTSDSQEQIM